MRQVAFRRADQYVIIEIDGNSLMFYDASTQALAPIDGLRLDKAGVIKEFPLLVDDPNWRKKAIEKFKEKYKGFETETEKMDYVIKELVRFGYTPLYYKKKGFREVRL